jgi:hypothetical protein
MPVAIAVLVLGLTFYFFKTVAYIFSDTPVKKTMLPKPASTSDAAKQYLSKSPYTCITFKNSKILAKDVGQAVELSFDTTNIDEAIGLMVKDLNDGSSKFSIKTTTEYEHHVMIELLYIFLPLLGREIDFNATALFKKKSESDKLFLSNCVLK